jgi:hypothetical protein
MDGYANVDVDGMLQQSLIMVHNNVHTLLACSDVDAEMIAEIYDRLVESGVTTIRHVDSALKQIVQHSNCPEDVLINEMYHKDQDVVNSIIMHPNFSDASVNELIDDNPTMRRNSITFRLVALNPNLSKRTFQRLYNLNIVGVTEKLIQNHGIPSNLIDLARHHPDQYIRTVAIGSFSTTAKIVNLILPDDDDTIKLKQLYSKFLKSETLKAIITDRPIHEVALLSAASKSYAANSEIIELIVDQLLKSENFDYAYRMLVSLTNRDMFIRLKDETIIRIYLHFKESRSFADVHSYMKLIVSLKDPPVDFIMQQYAESDEPDLRATIRSAKCVADRIKQLSDIEKILAD